MCKQTCAKVTRPDPNNSMTACKELTEINNASSFPLPHQPITQCVGQSADDSDLSLSESNS